MELTDLKDRYASAEAKHHELRRHLDLETRETEVEKLRQKSGAPDFWNDNAAAQAILKKISIIEKELTLWSDLEKRQGDVEVLLEFAESGDAELEEVNEELKSYTQIIEEVELQMILGDEHDAQDAIVTIHPGAGGTESQDWAEMLYRMYTRWVEQKGFKKDVMDYQPGDEAGLKDVTMEVKGDFAYGLLKAEAGIHRLVRISPFDSNSRRHTSFASVFVYPSSDEEIEIEIDQNELRIDTYRASGAGGQHVNKTDSAIRITHISSGIVVQCQNERSQHKNKATAMKVLKARLYKLEVEKQKEDNQELEDSKMDIGWGSQIRSYVFHPYNMVKDHRTKEETGNISAVMDGALDNFIRAFLMSKLK
ncbi:MAG TPA: peptide chain release factor 2 [Candidatus Marinimicrobia bacterium]|nr:peptide chain release factor 2 [Candidatus Neomarinimicrobiota bacterium]HJL75022.1 peptide chain release factor 2 [Candidatus Neomarinimicrobiota bacterium]HJM69962.1 peptide chain release factor 2 [Candidatus Neomarinimicrobiota bacterium]